MAQFISTLLIVAAFVLASGVIVTMLATQGRRIATVLINRGRPADVAVAVPRFRARSQPRIVTRPRPVPLRAAA